MLTGISWYQYTFFCGAALILYYLVLLVMYRRNIIMKFMKQHNAIERNTKRTWYPQETGVTTENQINEVQLPLYKDDAEKTISQDGNLNTPDNQSDHDMHYPLVHDLVDEIQAFFQASGRSSEKQEIMQSLQRLIQKYAVLKGTSFKEAINNLIISACENNCSIHLSENEVSGLWK